MSSFGQMLSPFDAVLDFLYLPKLSSGPASDVEALRNVHASFEELIRKGHYRPYVWPYCAIGPYLMIFYLLLPPTRSGLVEKAKYPLFAAIIYLSLEAIIHCRSAWTTYGYGIGLMNAFAILWSSAHLLFQDSRLEARRIEGRVRSASRDGSKEDAADTQASSTATQTSGTLRNRKIETEKQPNERNRGHGDIGRWSPFASKPDYFLWQPLPEEFLHRLDWVLDLSCSFRGPRWSHQIPNLPSAPARVQASLKDDSFAPPSKESERSRHNILRHFLPRFIVCLLMLDILKNVAMQDPYFWGMGVDNPSPFAWPRASRTLFSAIFVYHSLQSIFLLAPVVGCLLLGPARIGEHGWPWLYPAFFGSLDAIVNKGLAGAWGQWWHQLFRFSFEGAGDYVGRHVGWDKGSLRGTLLRVNVAFFCSGILHTCASYTAIPSTHPFNAFAFFTLQPIGLLSQRAFSIWLKKNHWRDQIPILLRQIGNICFVCIWFYYTGPLIADDFAACGIWLYEPLPISPIKGFRGMGWWRWTEHLVNWHADEQWWRSGLAF